MSDHGVQPPAATPARVRSMLWNSTVAFVVAQMIVIVLHEGAHAVTGLLQGYRAVQFAGEVRFTPEQTGAALVVTTLAGPVFSLVSGLVAMMFRPFRGHDFAELLWVWLAFLSAQEGFGYLTIAPLIADGDTGAALNALHAPAWVGWLCAATGLAGTIVLAALRCRRGALHPGPLRDPGVLFLPLADRHGDPGRAQCRRVGVHPWHVRRCRRHHHGRVRLAGNLRSDGR